MARPIRLASCVQLDVSDNSISNFYCDTAGIFPHLLLESVGDRFFDFAFQEGSKLIGRSVGTPLGGRCSGGTRASFERGAPLITSLYLGELVTFPRDLRLRV